MAQTQGLTVLYEDDTANAAVAMTGQLVLDNWSSCSILSAGGARDAVMRVNVK